MTYLLYVSAFFIVVSILILVHEFGHFLVANWCGVRVERFSIGFGKPFYTWKSKNGVTKYTIAPFLLGGYVKLLDTRETKVSFLNRRLAFDYKPFPQRLAVIMAGSLANMLFAFFAFWLMFVIGFKAPKPVVGEVLPNSIASSAHMSAGEEIIEVDKRTISNWPEVIVAMLSRIGDSGGLAVTTNNKRYELNLDRWQLDEYNPDPLLDFGLVRYKPLILPVVHEIIADSPAAESGLQTGDRIIKVGDKRVHNWDELIEQIKLYPKKRVELLIKRDRNKLELPVDIGWKFGRGWKKVGFLGVGPDTEKIIWPEDKLREYKFGVFSAILAAKHQLLLFLDLNRVILGKLVTGKISSSILGGPIATFAASGKALEQGFITFLSFLAVISLTIAIINLLPLPGLDGGYLIIILIEAIRRRPISLRTQSIILRLGIIIFIMLILHTTVNDLTRIFG